jgi:hypothetical protein
MTAGLLLIGGVPCTVLATHSMSFLGLSPIFAGTLCVTRAFRAFSRGVRFAPAPRASARVT